MSSLVKLFKEHFWGVILIVVLLIGSNIAVKAWRAKHPGAMSVLESQAMDMTVMKPPVGAVPVATETVHFGEFSAKVTYTGSVAPYQEQVVYPRVEGTLRSLVIYNGDRVSAGQLVGVIDSPDLQSKVAEASAGHAAAASEISSAQSEVSKMVAEREAMAGEVATARSELARAKAMAVAANRAVTQRQKEVKAAKASLEFRQAEIARDEKLLKAGAVSLSEYQSQKAEATVAEAEYENKLAMLEEAKADVDAAQAEVAAKKSMISVAQRRVSAAGSAVSSASQMVRQKSAMTRQAGAMVATAATIDQYRYVKAPFAGTVTKRYVSPGQFVTPSTAIANIVQIDKVRLQANVSDRDLEGIRIGSPVVARFAKDSKRTINATVTSISPLADQSSRTAVVEAIVTNPGHKLGPGDAVTLDIAVSGVSDTISVPTSAVVEKEGMSAVWIAKSEAPKGKQVYYCTMHPEVTSDKPDDCYKCNMKLVPKTSDGNKKARLVMVATGASSGDRIEVVSGISDGDEVIYRGNTYLKDGDTVFPTQWSVDGPKKMPNAPGMSDMPDMPGMDHSGHNMKAGPADEQAGQDMGSVKGMDHSKMKMDSPKPAKKAAGKQMYECPMHPHEMSHNPNDECKICGMKINQPVKK